MPDTATIKKLASMSSGNKEKRRECLKLVLATMIQINVSDPGFKPGTYKNNLGQGVKISASSNGKFSITSGKGFTTKAEIVIDKSFEPDLQFRGDADRHMCVCNLVSGDIAIDGDSFVGTQPVREAMMGGSEYVVSDCNIKAQAWEEIIASTEIELECKIPLAESQSRLCGLLKFVMMKSGEVSEYHRYADLIHTAIAYEPLAALYILMQPYGVGLMPEQVGEDWSFAPFICEDPKGLVQEYCGMFPCKIDKSKREQLVSSLHREQGINKLYDLQEIYAEKCSEMFSSINYPCEMKLWCDEVCFYICNRMSVIRKTHDVAAFRELCESLRRIYPGKSHKSESIINHDDYWNGFDKSKEIRNVGEFVKSCCFFQSCCCCEVPSEWESCLTPMHKSKYFKNLIYLNH
jgi:hypothetical protein